MNQIRAILLLLAASAAFGAEAYTPATPDDVYVQVAADLKTLPDAQAQYARYASLRVHPTEKERDDVARLFTAQLHDLSRRPGIFPLIGKDKVGTLGVARVSPTLLRFDVTWFGPHFFDAYERLDEQEPYYHGDSLVPTEGYKEVEYGYWVRRSTGEQRSGGNRKHRDEYWVTSRVEKEPTEKDAVLVRGFFLRTEAGKEAFRYIQSRMVDPRNLFGGTQVPVIDADWFISQTAADVDRTPGYHDFLDFDTLADWERVVGLVRDPKAIDPVFLTELREAVSKSGVANKEVFRRVVHYEKAGGDVWYTLDSNQRRSKGDPRFNPFSEFGPGLKTQAIEALGHLRNGFVAKGLFNGDGVRQDVAPDFIATDSTAPYQDTRVHTGLCFRCHVSGFQDFKMYVRDKLNANKSFLGTTDPRKAQDLFDAYVTTRLEPFLEGSRARYAAAMMAATGWTPIQYSQALRTYWKEYAEKPVTVESSARRLGLAEEQWKRKLVVQDEVDAFRLKDGGHTDAECEAFRLKITSKHDTNLGLLREGDSVEPIVFQQVFQRAADVAYGVARPVAIKVVRKK